MDLSPFLTEKNSDILLLKKSKKYNIAEPVNISINGRKREENQSQPVSVLAPEISQTLSGNQITAYITQLFFTLYTNVIY